VITVDDDYLWDPAATPSGDITPFEDALARYRFSGVPMRERHAVRGLRAVTRTRTVAAWMLAAATVGFVLLVGKSLWLNRPAAPWTLVTETGTVAIQGDASGRTVARAGDVLITDAVGRARLSVGTLGNVYLAPQSEVEVATGVDGTERLVLRRGELHARIWAPPRHFAVTTRSGTVTDLGCVFTMRADSTGVGSLEVWQGAVELTDSMGTIYLAAGTTAPLGGPRGLPYPVQSQPAFRSAARTLASGAEDGAALAVLLADTSVQSTITLWHLVPHVTPTVRVRLLSRIAEVARLSPAMAASAVRVSEGDSLATAMWTTALRPHWSSEPNTAWRRFLVRWGFAKPVALLQQRQTSP
jgi:hypothetical protein